MARIGIDLDGCLYDFGRAFQEYMATQVDWPKELQFETQESWHFYRDMGLSDAGFKHFCHQAADETLLWGYHAPRYPDIDALKDLRAAGHTLHIITDRSWGRHPGVSQAATARWLSAYSVPYDTLTFSPDKTIVKTDFMFDDKPANITALTEAGTKAYVYDQPWNRDFDHPHRISSVREFATAVHPDLPPF